MNDLYKYVTYCARKLIKIPFWLIYINDTKKKSAMEIIY